MSDHKAKDAAMASYMKDHPGSFPDSVMRPWNGNGADLRNLSKTMGRVPNNTAKFDFGLLGGVLVARLTGSKFGIPDELL